VKLDVEKKEKSY